MVSLGHTAPNLRLWLHHQQLLLCVASRTRSRLALHQAQSETGHNCKSAQECHGPISAHMDPLSLRYTARERLIALLVVYDSPSLSKVDALLAEFVGRELDLFVALGKRFGVSTQQALNIGTPTLF